MTSVRAEAVKSTKNAAAQISKIKQTLLNKSVCFYIICIDKTEKLTYNNLVQKTNIGV